MLGTDERVRRRNATNQRAAELASRADRLTAELAYFEVQRRSWDTNEADDAIRKLNQRCETQANALIAAHAALPPSEPVAARAAGHTRLAVLQSREGALKAELHQLQAGVTREEIETHSKGVASHTLEDVLKAVSDIDVTVAQLVSQTADNQAQAKKEQALVEDRQQLNVALRDQLQADAALERPDEPASGRPQRMEEATRALHQTNKLLMSQLSMFLDSHYPSEAEGHGVKELLQDLMNRAVTRPDEPWLLLTAHNASPESVELLLRARIAVKDDEDSRRVRLVRFY